MMDDLQETGDVATRYDVKHADWINIITEFDKVSLDWVIRDNIIKWNGQWLSQRDFRLRGHGNDTSPKTCLSFLTCSQNGWSQQMLQSLLEHKDIDVNEQDDQVDCTILLWLPNCC